MLTSIITNFLFDSSGVTDPIESTKKVTPFPNNTIFKLPVQYLDVSCVHLLCPTIANDLELVNHNTNVKYSDVISDGGMDPRDRNV